MGNVLSDEKQQQVIALGRLGWSLRRIEETTGVRRETASGYLKAAGVSIRPPGKWGKAKPANGATTDSAPGAKPANGATTEVEAGSNPAIDATAEGAERGPALLKRPEASLCAPFEALVEERLRLRRNAVAIWQELVDEHGFTGGYESV